MILIKVKSPGIEEFYISNTVPSDSFKDAIDRIKRNSGGNSSRVKVEEVEILNTTSVDIVSEMKYISTINEEGIKEIFIFPSFINHSDMYRTILTIDSQFRKEIGAGFTNGIDCYGRSETLNLNSNSEDHLLIT